MKTNPASEASPAPHQPEPASRRGVQKDASRSNGSRSNGSRSNGSRGNRARGKRAGGDSAREDGRPGARSTTSDNAGTAADTSGSARSAKGARARAKLKAAALIVLEREGYHRMRIADVTREAGVAQGLFYHYFSDLKSLTVEVLTDFVNPARELEDIERGVARGDWYGRIYAHNRLVVNSYARRPGVMRCLLQMADEEPEFSALLRDSYREQLMWLVKLMPRLFPSARFKKHQALMTVYSLAGIGEGLLREYFINGSKTLRAADLSVEQFTELLSTMFYRALFLEHPPAQKLKYTRNLAAMSRCPD